MKQFAQYADTKNLLLRWYERILSESDLLAIADSGRLDTLREARHDLRDERFVMAVCGQMNSGKSTLLNALLFGKEVLPCSPTTMTAKIVTMAWGETESVVARFYTPEQFALVRKSAHEDPDAEQELDEGIRLARAHQVRERDVISVDPHVEQRSSLSELGEFVAVADEGGYFSPYVKDVQLTADVPWLREITVVDTPGTNDPNPNRDRMTREWIERADAVVYVTYAGQAGMDAVDLEFIGENLLHIDPRRRIIAVNKCDTVDDLGAVRAYLERLRRDARGPARPLFADTSRVVLTSALGELMRASGSGDTGSEQGLQLEREGLDAGGWLDSHRNGMDELRRLIETSVLGVKGDVLVASHQRRIDAVFLRRQHELESSMQAMQEHLKLLEVSAQEAAVQAQNVQRATKEFSDLVKLGMNNTYSEIKGMETDVHRLLVVEFDNMMHAIMKTLGEAEHTRQFVSTCVDLLPGEIWRRRTQVASVFWPTIEKVRKALEQVEQDVGECCQVPGFSSIEGPAYHFVVSPEHICKKVEIELQRELEQENFREIVRKVRKDVMAWHQMVYERKRGLDAVRMALEKKFSKILMEKMESVRVSVAEALRKAAHDAIADLESRTGRVLAARMEFLAQRLEDDSGREVQREKLHQDLVDSQCESERVRNVHAEFQAELRMR